MSTRLDDIQEALERYVDCLGLSETIELLATICEEKAEHIRENWQDQSTAQTWDKDAKALNDVWRKLLN